MVSAPAIPAWLARLYPFAPRSFRTPGGARMSYLDEGPRGGRGGADAARQSDLVLLLTAIWSASLSPRLRCVVPDHIGMGLSDKPPGYDYRLATRIADVGGAGRRASA